MAFIFQIFYKLKFWLHYHVHKMTNKLPLHVRELPFGLFTFKIRQEHCIYFLNFMNVVVQEAFSRYIYIKYCLVLNLCLFAYSCLILFLNLFAQSYVYKERLIFLIIDFSPKFIWALFYKFLHNRWFYILIHFLFIFSVLWHDKQLVGKSTIKIHSIWRDLTCLSSTFLSFLSRPDVEHDSN